MTIIYIICGLIIFNAIFSILKDIRKIKLSKPKMPEYFKEL